MPRKRKNELDIHIGMRLRLRRLMLGMSQEVLGEKLSLTFQQVQKYEKGANRISASRLYEIAEVLNVPLQYFFEDFTEPDDDDSHAMNLNETGIKLAPYFDFISSGEGLHLNRAFAQIKDVRVRRAVITMVQSIAQSNNAS